MEQKEGGAPNNTGDGKKEARKHAAFVMKMEIHCDACAKKLKSLVRKSSGVEDVEIDLGANKLMVTGKVDPVKLREKLESKTHKKIELVSPLPAAPAKDGGSDKKPEEKSEKKADEKKPAPKESTAELKIALHCDGCANKIKRMVSKFQGVSLVEVDLAKDSVTVTGTMEVKDLVLYLQTKLKRVVEVAPPKKNNEGSAGVVTDKKEKPSAPAVAVALGGDGGEKKKDDGEKKGGVGDGGEKKKDEGKKDDGESKSGDAAKKEGGVRPAAPKMEAQKMEHNVLPYRQAVVPMPPPRQYAVSLWQSGQPAIGHQFWSEDPYTNRDVYGNRGGFPAMRYEWDGYPMDHRAQAPQMFSDENPNACSVM